MKTQRRLAQSRVGRTSFGIVCAGAMLLAQACTQDGAPTMVTSPTGAGARGRVFGSTASEQSADVAASLSGLRQATARYHDLSAALADGYQLGYHGVVDGCIALPGVGAMGYHYFNWAKMDDPSIVGDDPEVLVYHTSDDGTLVLGAVEWIVPKALWDDAGNTAPPEVFGQTLHIINPVLNWYIEHAWIWTPNPSGMFSDWNPDVSCP